jgi:hypothetical protein
VTGPATNAAAIVIIWKMLGRRTAIIYLLTVAGCALAGGFLLDFLGGGQPPMAMAHHGWMLPRSVEYVSAVILFIVLGFAIMQRRQTDE